MAKVTKGVFSVAWTTTFAGSLNGAAGGLVTYPSYIAQFGSFYRPWLASGSWSKFWASYLGSNKKLRSLSPDSGWDHLVPLMTSTPGWMSGPPGSSAEARVLLYPGVVSVVIRVEAAGDWGPREFASALRDLRSAKTWEITAGDKTSRGRSLDGIATDLRDSAAATVNHDTTEAPTPATLTVTAPLEGEGTEEELDVVAPEVGAALAGLAVVGPPGKPNEKNLLEQNSDTRLASRAYVTRSGHALWNAGELANPSAKEAVACLHSNQTSLVVHIAALSGVVTWAHEKVARGIPVPEDALQLVQRAAFRLEQLHAGDPARTYRSGVAKLRIEPLLPKIAEVKQTVGTL